MNNNTPPKDTKHARDVCALGLMAVFSIFVQPSSVILNQTLHMLLWLIWFSEWFWRAQTKCLLGKGSEVPFLSHSSWMHRLPNTDVGCTTSWTSGCYLPNTSQKKAQTIQSPATPWGCHCAIYEGPGAVGTSLFASLQLFATTPSPTDTSRWKSFPVLSCFPFCCQSHLLNPSFLLSDLVFSPLSIYQLFFL